MTRTAGLPAKSGVGGAVLLVVPGLMGICIWSPRLDGVGNSVRGVDFARRLARAYTLHMYDSVHRDLERGDPRIPALRRRARQVVVVMLWAAAVADLGSIRRRASWRGVQ